MAFGSWHAVLAVGCACTPVMATISPTAFRDLRGTPIESRKSALAKLLHATNDGIAFNKHFDGDGMIVFQHACALGCEGIVSKRLGSHYRSGRVDHWLKIKNPAAPAVKREAEEDWSGKRWTFGRRRRGDHQ
jgi:hypothetical protein